MKKLLPPKQFIGVPIDAVQAIRSVRGTARMVYTFWYLDQEGNVRRNSYSGKTASSHAMLQMQLADQRKSELKDYMFHQLKRQLQVSFPGIHLSILDTDLELRAYEDFNAYYYAVMQEALMIYDRPLATLMVASKPRLENGVYRFVFSFPSFVSYEMICTQKDEIKQVIADYIGNYATTHRQFANRVLQGNTYKDVPPVFTHDHQLIYSFEPKIRKLDYMFSEPECEMDYAM